MKLKSLIATCLLALTFAGCKTSEYTPYPETTTAVLVGIGYTCDKEDIQKPGSALDIATMHESIRYCYNDLTTTVTDGSGKGISTKDYVYQPKCTYRILQDENATLANVKAALSLAVKDDLAIIYFSCKAKQVPATTDLEEEDGLDEALMLYDGLLLDNDIWSILQTAKGRVFIFFDTGHSATMFKAGSTEDSDTFLVDLCDEIVKDDKANLNIVCWSACLDNETIREKGIGSKMTNVFYLKMEKWDTYDYVFSKIQKKLDSKQNIKKTVIGEDFSDKSMFR